MTSNPFQNQASNPFLQANQPKNDGNAPSSDTPPPYASTNYMTPNTNPFVPQNAPDPSQTQYAQNAQYPYQQYPQQYQQQQYMQQYPQQYNQQHGMYPQQYQQYPQQYPQQHPNGQQPHGDPQLLQTSQVPQAQQTVMQPGGQPMMQQPMMQQPGGQQMMMQPGQQMAQHAMQQPGQPGQLMPGQTMPGQPMQGQPMPGQPMQGQPMQGQPMPGQPMQGQPMPGQPMPGQPMPGQPMQGQPMQGQPIPGQPMQGQPMQGQPMPGQPMQGQPMPGQPMPGQPVGTGQYPPQNAQQLPPQTGTPLKTPTMMSAPGLSTPSGGNRTARLSAIGSPQTHSSPALMINKAQLPDPELKKKTGKPTIKDNLLVFVSLKDPTVQLKSYNLPACKIEQRQKKFSIVIDHAGDQSKITCKDKIGFDAWVAALTAAQKFDPKAAQASTPAPAVPQTPTPTATPPPDAIYSQAPPPVTPHATPPTGGQTIWYWRHEDGTAYPYDNVTNSYIAQCFQSGQPKVALKVKDSTGNDLTFIIDFQKGKQIREGTGAQRDIFYTIAQPQQQPVAPTTPSVPPKISNGSGDLLYSQNVSGDAQHAPTPTTTTATAPSIGASQWLWKNDKNQWEPYDQQVNQLLNNAVAKHLPSVQVALGPVTYTINFQTLKQVRPDTKKERDIMCSTGGPTTTPSSSTYATPTHATPTYATPPPQPKEFVWFDDSTWRSYSDDVNNQLNRAMTSGKPIATININGTQYEIDFTNKKQKNLKTSHVRNIDWDQDTSGPVTLGNQRNFITAAPAVSTSSGGGTDLSWIKPHQLSGGDNLQMVKLNPTDDEYQQVETRFKATIPKAAIIQVEKVVNQRLRKLYDLELQLVQQKNGNKQIKDCVKLLFHGTKNTHPSLIYNGEKGFMMQFAAEGLWGKGTYFAEKSIYSHDYCFSGKEGKQMFLAEVIVGDTKYFKDPDRTLRLPPEKQSQTSTLNLAVERYDSVSGDTNGSRVYIVYDNNKAYPAYLITYRR